MHDNLLKYYVLFFIFSSSHLILNTGVDFSRNLILFPFN